MEPKKILKTHSFLYGLDIILGYKSNTFIDEGIIYAPYILEEFIPRRGIASRYAQKIVNNSFYGIVSVGSNIQNTEI